MIIDAIAAICAPIFVLLTQTAIFVVELLIHIVAALFHLSWISLNTRGITRASYIVAALAACHLLSALILPFTSEQQVALLSPFYSMVALGVSALVFLTASFLPTAIENVQERENSDRARAEGGKLEGQLRIEASGEASELVRNTGEYPITLLSYVLAFAVVIGALSAWSAQSERKTLQEKLCAELENQIDPIWKNKGERALKFGERLLRRDLRSKLPCLRSTEIK